MVRDSIKVNPHIEYTYFYDQLPTLNVKTRFCLGNYNFNKVVITVHFVFYIFKTYQHSIELFVGALVRVHNWMVVGYHYLFRDSEQWRAWMVVQLIYSINICHPNPVMIIM